MTPNEKLRELREQILDRCSPVSDWPDELARAYAVWALGEAADIVAKRGAGLDAAKPIRALAAQIGGDE